MSKNLFVELSDAMADAAERAGKSTMLVDARRRFPASGIAFAKDLILTADHVVERDEDNKEQDEHVHDGNCDVFLGVVLVLRVLVCLVARLLGIDGILVCGVINATLSVCGIGGGGILVVAA